MNPHKSNSILVRIDHAHQLYCAMTGQTLALRWDRQQQWYHLIKAGYQLEDIRRVIRYLQREIRQGHRNVGALKLSNLLQLDRFEEDLAISQVRLHAPSPPPIPAPKQLPSLSETHIQQGRQRALQMIQQLRQSLR